MITVIVNGLLWRRTEIVPLLLRLHPSTAFWTLVDYDGYSISSKGLLVESSDKTWSTGEGNGKPLQYSCHENPMNSMKSQKDRTLKDELPWSVGAQ